MLALALLVSAQEISHLVIASFVTATSMIKPNAFVVLRRCLFLLLATIGLALAQQQANPAANSEPLSLFDSLALAAQRNSLSAPAETNDTTTPQADPNVAGLETDAAALDRSLLTQTTPPAPEALKRLAEQAERNARRAQALFNANELRRDTAEAYTAVWAARAQTDAVERFREGLSRQFAKTANARTSRARAINELNNHILRELGLKREALLEAQKLAEQRLVHLIGADAYRPLSDPQITRQLVLTEAELERQLPRHPAILMADQHRIATEALARLNAPESPLEAGSAAATAAQGPTTLSMTVPQNTNAYEREYRRLSNAPVKQAYAEFVHTFQSVRRALLDAMQRWRSANLALEKLQRAPAGGTQPLSQQSAAVLRRIAPELDGDWIGQLRDALQAEIQEINLKQTIAENWAELVLGFSHTDLLRRSLMGAPDRITPNKSRSKP